MKKKSASNRARLAIGIGGIFVILALLCITATPRFRGAILSGLRFASNLGKAVLDSHSVSGNGDFTNIIFLHHSCGYNLIHQGGVREKFTAAGYDFWDYGYNDQGLTRPDGTAAGYSYNIPNDNTDPDDLARIFAQHVYKFPVNALSGLFQHGVIAFKSCFPVSNITSDEQLETYKTYYLNIRDVMDQYPDKIFIVVTQPPLNPAATDAEAAGRARALAEWVSSPEYLSGHPNVFCFDFFNYLAEDDPASSDYNVLKAAYRDGTDSHPNMKANETIGPLFVDFILNAIQTYRATYQPTDSE